MGGTCFAAMFAFAFAACGSKASDTVATAAPAPAPAPAASAPAPKATSDGPSVGAATPSAPLDSAAPPTPKATAAPGATGTDVPDDDMPRAPSRMSAAAIDPELHVDPTTPTSIVPVGETTGHRGAAPSNDAADTASAKGEDAGATNAGREPSVLTPLPELCRVACDNALGLVVAELPSDTAKAMRDEVTRALERDCPGRCLKKASIESARCIANAKSALELAACP